MKVALRNLFYLLFQRFIIRRAGPGAIYLTFDDGPHPLNTAKILQVLDRHDTKATFFMIGQQMEAHPEIVDAAILSGHTIGYHSYSHRSLKKCNLNQIREDFARVDELSSRFDYPIKLYRPPFGDLTPIALAWVLLHRWKIVMWSLDCRDSFDSVDQVKANVAPDKLIDGEIILFHDDYQHVEELIETVLQSFKDSKLVCKSL